MVLKINNDGRVSFEKKMMNFEKKQAKF